MKKFESRPTFSRFNTIPACDGQTSCHGIVRACAERRVVKMTYTCACVMCLYRL